MRRFSEKEVWNSGKFTVDDNGFVWRQGARAEKKLPLGYLQVRVMVNNVRYCTGAHRLVWHALNGPIPKGLVVNHKNGIKDDNRPENLEVCTDSENLSHAHRTGLINQTGQKNPAAKLTDLQVEEIRAIYGEGKSTMKSIANQFGVVHQTVSKIIRGERRASQPGKTSKKNRIKVRMVLDSLTEKFKKSKS